MDDERKWFSDLPRRIEDGDQLMQVVVEPKRRMVDCVLVTGESDP